MAFNSHSRPRVKVKFPPQATRLQCCSNIFSKRSRGIPPSKRKNEVNEWKTNGLGKLFGFVLKKKATFFGGCRILVGNRYPVLKIKPKLNVAYIFNLS